MMASTPPPMFGLRPLGLASILCIWFGSKTEAFVVKPAAKNAFFTTLLSASTTVDQQQVEIASEVGRGSYGIVHFCHSADDEKPLVCKRVYTQDEMEERLQTTPSQTQQTAKQRLERCNYYWNVERHCFEKLGDHPQIPPYRGVVTDAQGNSHLAFGLIESNDGSPAPTLQDVMDLDWKSQHEHGGHHLVELAKRLGLHVHEDDDDSFGKTLDIILQSLLQVLEYVHSKQVCHRDVKPANLLVTPTGKLVLIDFGSAADLEVSGKSGFPWSSGKRVGLEDKSRVAVSPIYSAPEVFIRPDRAPFQFDVFSAALIFCQLLFNYLDERTDAGFHQQLEDANWDLDLWLTRELGSKVRPAGLEEAMDYLGDRPGLWRLLGDMLRQDPEQRVSSTIALERFVSLKTTPASDGPFLESVISLMQECAVAPPAVSRPLHFVATFRRQVPLGLVLSEVQDGEDEDNAAWKEATAYAQPGEVFVKDIVPDSQADQMGIFEIGDHLHGVGELPLADRGFEQVIEMLDQQPARAKYVKLHFDRMAARKSPPPSDSSVQLDRTRVVAQGAWSTRGRRKAQEDMYVLHEIHEEHDILLAGVFDGHGGTAASHAAHQMVPYLMSENLRNCPDTDVKQALVKAWETTCETYRHGCLEEECIAKYDPLEGTLEANTGSTDLVAGTTASLVAVQEGIMTVLNCGDSRSLLFESKGSLVFGTMDHTPDAEMERLKNGVNYSTPKCSLSKWYLSVGDYQYAVARSLEGPFATSRGIVSDADVTSIPLVEDGIVVTASDGLFEVMDNEEVGRDVVELRSNKVSAGDAAKKLCSMALEKGSSDNISVVVVYLGS